MRARLKQSQAEWAFVGLLAGLCAVLSVLQFHWTGQVSRAEAERLHAGINQPAKLFCVAFDAELAKSCEALVPGDYALNFTNREAVHLQHFLKWKSDHPRPIFSRIFVMLSTPGGAWLFNQDLASGQLVPSTTPPFSDAPSPNISRGPGTGPRPYQNQSGLIFPVFVGQSGNNRTPFGGGPPRGGGWAYESELMIFELDTNYLVNTWLPELSRKFLNSPGPPLYDIEVKTFWPPTAVIYSSPGNSIRDSGLPVTELFNRQGRNPVDYRGPGGDFTWLLEVRPHPGALEAIVASSRRRNLALAIFMNGLIFAAGLALVRHTRRSRQLAAAQLDFVATVSHELRTPLTVIRGAGHNLLRGVAHEPRQIEQYSKLIIQHAEQLTEMVEQILGLAGIKKSSAAALRGPVAIGEALREAVVATASDAKSANCAVHIDSPPALPSIHGDAQALRRVFQNLISNAAKHGGQSGWIGITATMVEAAKPPMIEIKVADRGPGIPKPELSEIFKPFFRGAMAQAMQIRGSGLGLALVKETVEAHGGTVLVENNLGGGAVFVVRLPVAKA